MNGNKLFAVSIAVLALALGFFLGTLKGGCCCGGMDMSCCKKGAPCEHSAMNAPCEHGNHHMGKHKGPHGDFKGPGPRFKGKMDFAEMDSLLQVTPEQKAAIEAPREIPCSRISARTSTKPRRPLAKPLKVATRTPSKRQRRRSSTSTGLCSNTASMACRRLQASFRRNSSTSSTRSTRNK